MEINIKIHVEQPAQHSDERDEQTDRQKNSTFLATPEAGEIRVAPKLAR